MALVVRELTTNRPVRALSFGNMSSLKPLFLRELRQCLSKIEPPHMTAMKATPTIKSTIRSIGYNAFRRLVLRDGLGLKLDARLFSSLARDCDPYHAGTISFPSFARHAKDEELLATRLGLRIERHDVRDGIKFIDMPKPRPSVRAAHASTGTSSHSYLLGPGFAPQRLRRELARAFSEADTSASERASQASRPNRGRQYRKPRRGLLRHEISQLRGAGILLTEGQIHDIVRIRVFRISSIKVTPESHHQVRTVAMDSWIDPRERSPQLAMTA